ncbi:MAG: helix-turn-helix transcriptional regulator [bacterium]
MTRDHQSRRPLSVSAMADLLGFSRQHFHELIKRGVFPPPVYHITTRRPMYVGDLQERCHEVLRSGVGENGQPVMFNNTRRRRGRKGQRQKRTSQKRQPTDSRTRRLAEQLAYLNVHTTLEQVSSALRAAQAEGVNEEEPALLGYLVRRLGGDASP